MANKPSNPYDQHYCPECGRTMLQHNVFNRTNCRLTRDEAEHAWNKAYPKLVAKAINSMEGF